MSDATFWWIAAGLLVVLELATMSFYLLMLAIGTVAAAITAHVGLPFSGQMIVGAAVGAGSVVSCYYARKRRPGDPSARADRSVNLDVGETIQIDQWDADGTAQIFYRGASWTAMLRSGFAPMSGTYRIVELVGIRLLVEPI